MAPEPPGRLDLSSPRRLHLVGVGGAGMSALATVLVGMGHRVSGSDTSEAPVLTRLADEGVDVRTGNRAEHVEPGTDAVVYSTAVPLDNVELRAAAERDIPVVHRGVALGAISAIRRTIAVAGSHGKTSSSALLVSVLRAAGLDPGFVIGADACEVGTNAAAGVGEWMVIEADESDGSFLHLRPAVAVVTNVEPDHLDFHGGFEPLVGAFGRFLATAPERWCCADDAVAARLATEHGARTYGEAHASDVGLREVRADADRVRFRVAVGDRVLPELTVRNGVKVAINATAAVAVASGLGVPDDAIAAGLAAFGGVVRRFEFRGERDGVAFVDDYAHLPTEVVAAIDTARRLGRRRVVVVFQPHRYSRTASIGPDFADAFAAADEVVITDVYPAGESPIPGVSGRTVLRAVLDRHPRLSVSYLPRRADLVDVPRRLARPGDVVLTLGAGDLTTMPDVWLATPGGSP
ncbi:MAG: UDP-N-acetylmuramate--L-alanine ligase [Actinomycetota bacterium]